MKSPYRGRPWIVRQTRAHPLVFAVALVCVAAVIVEIGASTHFFGLVQSASGGGGSPPSNLNPYGELIFSVNSTVTYRSGTSDYFPALDGTDLCLYTCPKTPVLVTKDGNTSIGVLFYVNVTNTGSSDESLSNLTLTTSGPDAQLFSLSVLCCYSSSSPSYQEPFEKLTSSPPGATVGLEGFAYMTSPIPYTGDGGYRLVLSSTSP